MIAALINTSAEVKDLDPVNFRYQLKNTKKARLIDVSTKDEHRDLHIPGSMNFDVFSPDFTSHIAAMDRNKSYFIYCHDGKKSESACRIMAEMGFKKLFYLTSGVTSWKGTLERSY